MGCRRYGYFILGHFVVGHIARCTDKILGDKTPVETARGDKMLTFSAVFFFYWDFLYTQLSDIYSSLLT